jgi:serine/threonine-protein phosphatase 2A regulatory subunit A
MFKDKFRQKFLELCTEETPIVRRSVAKQMGDMCQVLEREPLVNDVLPAFRQLAQDDQDQIRVICLDSLIIIAQVLNKEDNMRHTLPVALAAGEDKSWRIRI